MAKIEQACEVFNDDIRWRINHRFRTLYGYAFSGGPKPSKALKEDTMKLLAEGLDMFTKELEQNNGY